jgi:hypothetical protein
LIGWDQVVLDRVAEARGVALDDREAGVTDAKLEAADD